MLPLVWGLCWRDKGPHAEEARGRQPLYLNGGRVLGPELWRHLNISQSESEGCLLR